MINKIKNILKKKGKTKLVCLTSYSKNHTKILDKYCDIILVGDSLANVLYGMKNTHKIDLDTMIRHAISVRLAVKKSLLVVDMPKGTYDNIKNAEINATKLMKRSKCDAIKIESNKKNYSIIKALVKKKIPVMGHIGFTPQYSKNFNVKGSNIGEEAKLIREAKRIEEAGAFSIVAECIASSAAKKITKSIKIPTIGIGSSKYCDGQILVTDDILGLSGFYPKFVKKYINLGKIIENAVRKYKKEVLKNIFPAKKNSY